MDKYKKLKAVQGLINSLDGYQGTERINDKVNEIIDWINNNQFMICEHSYACPVCGLWCVKGGGHQHINIFQCDHDYIPYPMDYVSSSSLVKMMCRKYLNVEHLKG